MRATVSIAALVAALISAATAAHADVAISSAPTQNMNCSGGVCSPTAPNAILNATDLTNMLAGGSVKVTNGSGAVNIVLTATLSWSTTSRLTLEADNNLIVVQAPILVQGRGSLAFNDNASGPGGDLIFANGGNATFSDLKSGLLINAVRYTLVGTVSSLAHGLNRHPSGYYALANDYDASVNGTYEKTPIGEVQGVFEGLGHTISNLRIVTDATEAAFIGYNGGTTRDLSLVNEFVSGKGYGAAGLTQDNGGLVTRVFVSGSVQYTGTVDDAGVGGVVGYSEGGVISHTTAAVNVQALNQSFFTIGGLVGRGITIVDCHATGSVDAQAQLNGSYYAGGLAGEASAILLSSATGSVSASVNPSGYVGGLLGAVGNAGGTVDQSYATGAVSGGVSDHVGGLAGTAEVQDSYSTGSVKGGPQAWVGGLAVNASATNSYSTGAVSAGNNAHGAGPPYVGGFTGYYSRRAFSADYWDIDTSGTDVGCGYHKNHCKKVVGLTDQQLKSALPKGFSTAIWGQNPSINNGYPYLLANPPQ